MIGSSNVELEVEIVNTGVDGALVTVVVTTMSVDTECGAVTTAETVVWSVTGVSVVNGRVIVDDALAKVDVAVDASVEVVPVTGQHLQVLWVRLSFSFPQLHE